MTMTSPANTELLLRLYSNTACGLEATSGDAFGFSLTSLGDLNGDGVHELAIGIPYRRSPIYQFADAGAVCIVSFGMAHTALHVESSSVITLDSMGAAETPALQKLQQSQSLFGCAVASVGDLNQDGVCDLAASACGVDDSAGAVLILLLSAAGDVISVHVLSPSTEGGEGSFFAVPRLFLPRGDTRLLGFGTALSAVGDLDLDGVTELVMSVSSQHGLVIAHLEQNGTLRSAQPMRYANQTVVRVVARALSALSDISGDSIPDLAVGGFGKVSILMMQAHGRVAGEEALHVGADALFQGLDELDVGEGTYFGNALALSQDLNGDYTIDLAVGAYGQRDTFQGAVYVLNLRPGQGTSVKTSDV
jgi:hypothetical protein